MQYKSFSIPKDIYIPVSALLGIIQYRHRVNKSGYNNILKKLEGCLLEDNPGDEFIVKYNKFYKALSFFLIRLFKDPNPCMIRSLVLYGLCRKNNIKAVLKTGVKKNGKLLDGHSWVELNGEPLNENKEYLKGFTVIHAT